MTPQARETEDISKDAFQQSRGFFWLSDKAAEALPHFRYAGEDRSLLYKYMLSPFAGFLVDHCTPRSIAPNTITLFGLSLMVTSYCIMWHFSPSLVPNPLAPAWIFLFNCMAMLIYQTLDNMDGKQARRTGSSSPLGLLFDHGCDAANSIFGSANWIISIGLVLSVDSFMCWVLVLGPMALFYISTWEEYHTGKLILPIMNGPNEGLVLGALTSLTTCVFGLTFWQSTTWYDTMVEPYLVPLLPGFIVQWIPQGGLRNSDIQVLMACGGFAQETLGKIVSVTWMYGAKVLLNTLPFFTLCTATFMIGASDEEVWIRKPRTTLLLCSGLFVEMCTQLMLDHCTEERYQPFRWVLGPLVVLAVMIISDQWEAGPQTDDFLVMYASALWAFLLFKFAVVIHEICCVLNIFCFDITTPRSASAIMCPERKKPQ
jgi:ethanolaminephosphotransferase